MEAQTQAAGYPVQLAVEYPDRDLNRLTTALRIFAVIPIAIVLGSIGGSWGTGSYGDARSTTIAVGLPRDRLAPYFARVERVATLGEGHAQIDPIEQGRPVWL